jgi:hypothetical protein
MNISSHPNVASQFSSSEYILEYIILMHEKFIFEKILLGKTQERKN